ncbi:MAG: phosphate/phosphite/phosphonate ABC transporter substrate-binding protein [Gammaproteobacteria bacterium]|nr:phosphate/phosphite/phosphonate ABC transporter substrate-binding protein [Gammaproteobacteria bacterium]
MRFTIGRFGYVLVCMFFCFQSAPAAQNPIKQDRVYSFGIVPQFEQRKMFRIWQPILTQIEEKTGLRFKIKGSPKISSFETSFLAGEFDFAYMNPYHITLAHKSQGYVPLVRDGERSLQGILVVHRDSDISDIRELQGKTVAFPAPNALGASLIMRADFVNLFQISVKPKYVQTHSSVYLHVAKGLSSAGGGVLSTFDSQIPEIKNKLRILYTTRPIPPHPIAAHPRVPAKHRELLRKALLDLSKTQQGALMLSQIPLNKAIPAEISDYTVIRQWGLDRFYVSTNE